MGSIGIVANPASGKDIRRLVARASVFDNQEKQAIVRRALIGATAAGATDVVYLNDAHRIVSGAIEEHRGTLTATPVDATQTGTALDTISAARAFKDHGCSVVITLGGDGTNRAFALGWPDAPLIPISTGTNNVFPTLIEATIAGAAAGLIAQGHFTINDVARRHKLIRVTVDDEPADLALIDVVLSRERFVGARALLNTELFDTALMTIADPAAVGVTSVGGLLHPIDNREDMGLLLRFGSGVDTVCAPIAPGYYQYVNVAEYRLVNFVEEIEVSGPGVLAFDGERDRVLKAGQNAQMSVERSGPWIIDVKKTLHLAAEKGLFRR